MDSDCLNYRLDWLAVSLAFHGIECGYSVIYQVIDWLVQRVQVGYINLSGICAEKDDICFYMTPECLVMTTYT